MGHDVTLFASGDSITPANLVAVVPKALNLDRNRPDPLVWHTIMIEMVLKSAASFDVIHFHTDVLQLARTGQCATPCISTVHPRADLPDLKPLFRCFPHHPLVAVSHAQQEAVPSGNWLATVPYGLPLGLYQAQPQPQDYLACLGRIAPGQGLESAIAIAKSCGMPLRIAGALEPAETAFFQSVIGPRLDGSSVIWAADLDATARGVFIGGAKALLVTGARHETAMLAMIEAMACGTPVIACSDRTLSEVVDHGATGFIVSGPEQAAAAARELHRIDRGRCRQVFEQRFGARAMARRYLQVYRDLIEVPAAPPHRSRRELVA
jgi:glycosyltransferase involved in cell wall biosynthesis